MGDPETSNQNQAKDLEIARLKAQLEDAMAKLHMHDGVYEEEDDYSDKTLYHNDHHGRNSTHRPRPSHAPRDDIKVDIPEFFGKIDGDEFNEWIQTVERVFDYKEVEDECTKSNERLGLSFP